MNTYTPQEERINVLSHAIGFLLSVVALPLLLFRAAVGDGWYIASASVYGSSLVLLYAASTLYHSAKQPQRRKRLKIFDHAAIFVLIAGTYTPFTLITLHGTKGWIIFGVVWGVALIGIILKLFFTGRYKILSTILYILMGWMVIFAIKPLVDDLSSEGLFWLFMGGMFYTIGAILYGIKKIKFNHAIFHIFVLFGSVCHFIAVYFYVLIQT